MGGCPADFISECERYWGTTCEHCLATMPMLQAVADRWEPAGLTVLNVCADAETAEDADALVRGVSPQTQVWVDESGLANSRFDVAGSSDDLARRSGGPRTPLPTTR